jgi:hypothetical protein
VPLGFLHKLGLRIESAFTSTLTIV